MSSTSTTKVRVLVCGSRSVTQADHVNYLRGMLFLHQDRIGTLIHGAAPGADSIAAKWAFDNGVTIEAFEAEWKRFGKSAGPIRNTRMLKEGKPDVVLAFIDKPFMESRGTRNMVTQALDAKVPVHVYDLRTKEEVDLLSL